MYPDASVLILTWSQFLCVSARLAWGAIMRKGANMDAEHRCSPISSCACKCSIMFT